ncbi:non-reducing end alpha-L-arabinofuranosidase family hydrolase [Streptomyces sp. NPDC020192]|uniref:non-reducing end alpha-L-arabinofuranosidase family hydrolase n=1 Tax=Streptomyces sp. NPDC020192 TaxID=3365066 RepID=UPI0037B2C593
MTSRTADGSADDADYRAIVAENLAEAGLPPNGSYGPQWASTDGTSAPRWPPESWATGRTRRSWTASSLAGSWSPLAESENDPFARASNVTVPGTTRPC